jgi:hypothetical protein
MAGKFGADFNAAQPSDSDLVKKGAQWIRDIKTRIQGDFRRVFQFGDRQLLNNSVPSAALKDLNPDPTGTFREVDVNSKGQVTAGRNPTTTVTAKPYRWMYSYAQGFGPSGALLPGRSVSTPTPECRDIFVCCPGWRHTFKHSRLRCRRRRRIQRYPSHCRRRRGRRL